MFLKASSSMITAYIPNRVGVVVYWFTEFLVYTQSSRHSRIQRLDDFGKTGGTLKLSQDHM